MADAGGKPRAADRRARVGRSSRRAVPVVAFVGGLVFLLFVAGIGVSRIVDRAENDYTLERLETERWNCVESFVRASTTDGESLQLAIEPSDDPYVRQRVIESVYPEVRLTTSPAAPVLRVVVKPSDDASATCRGLTLSVDRS